MGTLALATHLSYNTFMPIKKIISHVASDSFEMVKDTVKQAGKIPIDVAGGMMEQAVSGGQQTAAQKQQSQQQVQQKAAGYKQKDEEELKKTRDALNQLKRMQNMYAPKPQQTPRLYEATIEDEERKKAAQVEAQKKQPLAVPTSKQTRGMLGKKKTKGSEGMVKDTRVG